ncbi:hypothetical protein HGG76_07955 [Ochrobactrum tritici]|uniref:Glycosyl transferase family 1 domain-containing protein n=1 Tax=Brucella tritici TaxID=94626 RepID=A0A7X6FRA2_9HYPH|nr:hypothetical protein [Brucella tritici]
MAAGRPIIAYDHGALPELIEHKVSGYLIPFKHYSDAIPYVQALCSNLQLIKTMGNEGRCIAKEKFSQSNYNIALESFYNKVYSKRDSLSNCESLQRITVAYFCWHFPVPSETFVLNEIRELSRQGYHVVVFCRQSPYPDFKPDFPVEWYRVEDVEQLASLLIEKNALLLMGILFIQL